MHACTIGSSDNLHTDRHKMIVPLLLLGSVIFASLGYIGWRFYTVPIPHGFSNPELLKKMLISMKYRAMKQSVQVALGYYTKVQLERMTLGSFSEGPPMTYEHMEIREMHFDDVKVRLYIPKKAAAKAKGYPGLVYYHGGGWVAGSTTMYDSTMSDLVRDLNLVIVSVDYRKAPEVVFPGPFEDCVAATKYFLEHASGYGVDPHRVAIGGDSSGGNLAAAVAIKLRDDDFSPCVKIQLLIYPCLQALDFSYPSMIQNKDGPILATEDMAWFWSLYITGLDKLVNAIIANNHTSKEMKDELKTNALSHAHLEDRYKYAPYSGPRSGTNAIQIWDDLKDKLKNPYLCPLMAKDLRGLPDAFIFTSQCDILRDEGTLYVKLLRKFGVNVLHSHMSNGFHVIWSFIGVFPEATLLYDEIVDFLKTRL